MTDKESIRAVRLLRDASLALACALNFYLITRTTAGLAHDVFILVCGFTASALLMFRMFEMLLDIVYDLHEISTRRILKVSDDLEDVKERSE